MEIDNTRPVPADVELLGWMCPVHRNVMVPPRPLGHYIDGATCFVNPDNWIPVYVSKGFPSNVF